MRTFSLLIALNIISSSNGSDNPLKIGSLRRRIRSGLSVKGPLWSIHTEQLRFISSLTNWFSRNTIIVFTITDGKQQRFIFPNKFKVTFHIRTFHVIHYKPIISWYCKVTTEGPGYNSVAFTFCTKKSRTRW